jgi:predicted glycoside hydrolase/deacetylase ChbG (UPF0249 family)
MPHPVRVVEPGRRLLIVSGDEYGRTEPVSRAIITAHRRGIVTSASVVALTPAFERCVRWLADTPRLGVGAHLTAVGDDAPLLSAAEIPTLVDRRGRLRTGWRQLLPRLTGGRVDPSDLRREFAAQLERLTGAGLQIDHLDTHQDLHRWPVVRKVVLDLAERHGIPAVRVCRTSAHSPSGFTERRLAHALERRCRERGLAYPRSSTGDDGLGHLDLPGAIRALHRLSATGAPSAELVTHPGDADELAALTSGTVGHAVKEYGFVLGTYADLVAPPVERAPAAPTEAAG